jgi:hypothetical protein
MAHDETGRPSSSHDVTSTCADAIGMSWPGGTISALYTVTWSTVQKPEAAPGIRT